MATEHSSPQADGSYKRAANKHAVKVSNAESVHGYEGAPAGNAALNRKQSTLSLP